MKTKTSIRLSDAALANLRKIMAATGSNQTATIENALAIYNAWLTTTETGTINRVAPFPSAEQE